MEGNGAGARTERGASEEEKITKRQAAVEVLIEAIDRKKCLLYSVFAVLFSTGLAFIDGYIAMAAAAVYAAFAGIKLFRANSKIVYLMRKYVNEPQ
jgi:hypothetical protein